MMGSTSSGKDWPQTKSQIITNITAHYKRSLSSNNNNNSTFSFSDLLDRTNDFDANVTPSPGSSPLRAKLPISTSLRISTYDNVSAVTPNAEESVSMELNKSNNKSDCVQTTNNSTCSRSTSHQPSVEPSSGDNNNIINNSRGHFGNTTDTSKPSRSRSGSNFWSSQRHRSRNSSSRESAGVIDENAEWAEIEKIMSSFGAGIVRHSVFEQEGYEQQISRHLSTQPNSPTTQSTAALETESTASSSAGLWSVSSASGISSGSSSSGVHDSSSSTVGTTPNLSDISSFDVSTRPTSQGRLSDFLRPPTTMRDWLLLIGLATYEKNFVNNGFDDPNFLDCIEEDDLIDMGVSDFEHRMELLQAVSMPSMIDVSDENFADADLSLESWLSSLNLLVYRDNFARSGITDYEQASKAISDGRLFKMAGVTLLGHQRRMLQSIWKRNPSLLPRPSLASSNASSDSLGFEDCFPRKLSSDSDIFERNQLVVDQKRRHDERLALTKMAALYQDKAHASRRQIVDAELDENRKALDAIAAELLKFEMSIPPPSPAFPSLDSPTSSYELKKKSIPLMREPSFAVLNEDRKPFLTSQSVDEGFFLSSTRVDDDTRRSRDAEDVKTSPRALTKTMKKARRKISAQELAIRPPHQSQPAHQQPPVQNWCHSPEKLLKSSCDYNAFYLGSTLLNDLQENQSIIKSIKKMKSSTQNIQKLPSITLSISYRGVSFRDSTTAIAICDHEVRNIHCAAQDDDDLRFLAYITKDVHVNKHFCHVFKAETMVSATEIILTLGQAFEVAFQLAKKVKSRTSTSSLSTSMRKLVDDPDSLPPRETIIS